MSSLFLPRFLKSSLQSKVLHWLTHVQLRPPSLSAHNYYIIITNKVNPCLLLHREFHSCSWECPPRVTWQKRPLLFTSARVQTWEPKQSSCAVSLLVTTISGARSPLNQKSLQKLVHQTMAAHWSTWTLAHRMGWGLSVSQKHTEWCEAEKKSRSVSHTLHIMQTTQRLKRREAGFARFGGSEQTPGSVQSLHDQFQGEKRSRRSQLEHMIRKQPTCSAASWSLPPCAARPSLTCTQSFADEGERCSIRVIRWLPSGTCRVSSDYTPDNKLR